VLATHDVTSAYRRLLSEGQPPELAYSEETGYIPSDNLMTITGVEQDTSLGQSSFPANATHPNLSARSLTQDVLQQACKRAGVSSSGSKASLIARLHKNGHRSYDEVQKLAHDFHDTRERIRSGVPPVGEARDREPNWHKNETARLCHVVADPRNATVLQSIYNKPENRAELDAGRHDPWSNDFPDLFNDESYIPDVPFVSGGTVQEEIDAFDPAFHRHKRAGSILKRKWTNLRSRFSVAYTKWTASGQGDAETFPNFVDGDISLAYMFCVFHGKPSLEYAIRLLPAGAQSEQGIPGHDAPHHPNSLSASRKRRSERVSSTSSFAEAASQIAAAISQPLRIEQVDPSDQRSGSFKEHSDMADTVVKLMDLEGVLQKAINECDSEERKSVLMERLKNISKRIASSMGI
jgi:hypothetical protein